MRRRLLIGCQAVLALVAVLCAVGVVRAEVVDQTSATATPVDVSADAAVELAVTAPDADEHLEGTFTVLQVTDHARLTPSTEYEDPIERAGGRVVVIGLRCDCPVSDDLLAPAVSVTDTRGRVWEADTFGQPRPDEYAELAGYSPAHRFGEESPYHYAVVIIVPAEVADEVRVVLHRAPGPAYRFAR